LAGSPLAACNLCLGLLGAAVFNVALDRALATFVGLLAPQAFLSFGHALIFCSMLAAAMVVGKVQALPASPHQSLNGQLILTITAIHIAPYVVAPVVIL